MGRGCPEAEAEGDWGHSRQGHGYPSWDIQHDWPVQDAGL